MFDAYCEHLLVRSLDSDGEAGPVIGTYRVLTPAEARRVDGLYSETEFDLTRLRPLRSAMVELGRSCVHADHRQGGVILALWGALAEFMQRNGLETMVGCASVSMRDGGHVAASLWERLRQSHLAPIEWQVQPRLALPVADLRRDLQVEAPPLIKGYLRLGAMVGDGAVIDRQFGTTDVLIVLPVERIDPRYFDHFGAPDEQGSRVAVNRKARHEYAIEDTLEAGLVLTGTEIKSIRAGKVNLSDAHARVERAGARFDLDFWGKRHGLGRRARRGAQV